MHALLLLLLLLSLLLLLLLLRSLMLPLILLILSLPLFICSWSVAIEAAIGYSFENFLCHSPRDRATLRQMASHAKCYMPKFTVVQCRFDLDQHKVPDRTRPVYQGRTLTTVMDVITINDRSKEVVILNYLIDSFQIEKSVLMEDPKRAADIMHARCGVNKTFDIYGTGYMVRQQSTARTHAKQCHPRLGMDSEDQLRQLAEAIEQSRGKARAAEQERLQLVSEVQEIERVSREAAMREQEFARTKKQAEHAMRSQAQTLARQQAELTQLMSSTAGDGDSAGDEMATQVAAATAGLFESQAALSDIESRLQAAKRVETEARTLYNEKMQFLASRQDTTSANAEEMEATAVRRVKLEAEVDATRRKLEIVTAKLDSLRAERAAKLEDLREVEKEAGNIGTEEEALVAMERVGEHFEKRVRASFEEKRRKGNPQVLAMSDAEIEVLAMSDAEVEENVVEIVKGHTSLDSMEREQIKMAKSIKATEESVGGDRDQVRIAPS
ncbi:hypothetical protein FOA52_012385 [Chlamydomonas sp. UWO 241]|nr:hypothetical protein FOA52_012385 [Chlamydomonas sp. UWO 241]